MAESKIARIRRKLKKIQMDGWPEWGKSFNKLTMHDKQHLVRVILTWEKLYLSHGSDHHREVDVVCACNKEKIGLTYQPYYATHWTYDQRLCRVGNWCYCINNKTLEMVRHRIGDCHLGRYGYEEKKSVNPLLPVLW